MRETTSPYNHIYSAGITMEYFLHLDCECIFVPISVELVLDREPILGALLVTRQHYLPFKTLIELVKLVNKNESTTANTKL